MQEQWEATVPSHPYYGRKPLPPHLTDAVEARNRHQEPNRSPSNFLPGNSPALAQNPSPADNPYRHGQIVTRTENPENTAAPNESVHVQDPTKRFDYGRYH